CRFTFFYDLIQLSVHFFCKRVKLQAVCFWQVLKAGALTGSLIDGFHQFLAFIDHSVEPYFFFLSLAGRFRCCENNPAYKQLNNCRQWKGKKCSHKTKNGTKCDQR